MIEISVGTVALWGFGLAATATAIGLFVEAARFRGKLDHFPPSPEEKEQIAGTRRFFAALGLVLLIFGLGSLLHASGLVRFVP
jgi:hypothetical protein